MEAGPGSAISESSGFGKALLVRQAKSPRGDVPSCSLLTGLTALLILFSKLAMLCRERGDESDDRIKVFESGKVKLTRN